MYGWTAYEVRLYMYIYIYYKCVPIDGKRGRVRMKKAIWML